MEKYGDAETITLINGSLSSLMAHHKVTLDRGYKENGKTDINVFLFSWMHYGRQDSSSGRILYTLKDFRRISNKKILKSLK